MNVVIIGKGRGWENAPRSTDGEIWGVNDLCLRRSVDIAFNMHDLDKHSDHKLFNNTVEHVNRHKLPIVTQRKYDHIPTSIEFPLSFFHREYFTNSIDYMVAYAYYRDMSHIDMYGVVMEAGTEYAVQKPSLEYWIGMFEGNGGTVTIHKPSHVCFSPNGLYGYEWDEELMEHVRLRPENQ